VLLEQLAKRDGLEVAQVAGMVVIQLVVQLIAGHRDLLACSTTM